MVLETSLEIIDLYLGNYWGFLADMVAAQQGTSVPPQNQDIGMQDDTLESHGQ